MLPEGAVCNRLAVESCWIADSYNFFTKGPSTLTIEALEESEVLLLDREQHQNLLKTAPQHKTYPRILYQNAYAALQRCIKGTIGLSAEEKYSHLLEQHPAILIRVPLHLIASYSGITPETLSCIRKLIAQ